MKRIYRQLSDETKEAISKATSGKQKSEAHKQHIAHAMRKYWSGIPNKPQTITMNDLIGARDNKESINPINNEKNM